MTKRLITGDDADIREIPKERWRPGCVTYIVAMLVLLGAAVWGGLRLWERSARLEFEAAIAPHAAAGEPIWFSDLAPQTLPADRDGTRAYQMAAQGLERKSQQPNSATVAFFNTHRHGTGAGGGVFLDAYTAADLANFRQMLAENEETLRQLRAALDKGEVRFPRDYDTPNPFGIVLEDVQAARGLGLMMHAQAVLSLSAGDPTRTLRHVDETFAVADLYRNDRILITQLVRIAVGATAIKDAAGLVSTLSLEDTQRAELDQALQTREAEFRMRDTVLSERCSLLTVLANLRSSGLSDEEWAAAGLNTFTMQVYSWFPALHYRDMTDALELLSQAAEAVDQTGPEGAAAEQRLDAAYAQLSQTSLIAQLAPATDAVHRAAMRYRQQLRGLRVALRVDAYYRREGKFPASLKEVLDDALPQIPLGTLSDQPLIYSRSATGFVIYEVGSNGIDDGLSERDESESSIELVYPELVPPTNAGN